MALLQRVASGIGNIAVLCIMAGCAIAPNSAVSKPAAVTRAESRMPAADIITIFFFREANYAGGGRIHLLKVDDLEIGEITGNNYYRIEVWPGEYQFTVFLPPENFFGQSNPPISISDRVRFSLDDAGSVIAYQFTDGMGNRGFVRKKMAASETLMHGRTLSASFSARDTAQVTMYLNARYDGPAINGRPHGKGTLTWPDGAVYRGEFEYGLPTNRASFFFTSGQRFMGLFYKGRPKSHGILMTPGGNILFAGDFVDEKPHGLGLRYGDEGPEFCIYDHGRDITKTFGQLAKEIIDAEDQAKIDDFSRRVDRLTDQIEEAKTRLFQIKNMGIMDSEDDRANIAQLENSILQLEHSREDMARTSKSDLNVFIADLLSTRRERESNKFAELRKDHQAKIEEERTWCEEESGLDRDICGCAPMAADFKNWRECIAPIGKKH